MSRKINSNSVEEAFSGKFDEQAMLCSEREKNRATERIARELALAEQAAEQRRQEGLYGICTKCGRQIDPARLEALPSATTCVTC